MTGKHLSHYLIESELGRGGMGIVYRARDTKLDRTIAIKVLPSAALTSDDDRARFYREAKAAAALTHANIAIVHAVDEAVPEGANTDDLRPFIAMEFVEGDTLAERIAQGPLKLDEAVRIASAVAAGLEVAHEKEIVHRDIKAGNIMLTAKGEPKILDFGLAQTAASTKLTRMGSTLGTVAYMSPEQTRGEPVDQRTDIWSLGAVLYEMIAGRAPFAGDYEQALVYGILNEDPEPLTAVRTGVPMGLEWVVNKCLAKDRGDRYQSAADLIVDLRNIDLSVVGASRISTTSSQRVAAAGAERADINRPSRLWTVILPLLAAVLVVVAFILGQNTAQQGSGAPDSHAIRTEIVLPPELPMAFIGNAPLHFGRTALDISPDGLSLVYVAWKDSAVTQLAVRDMDSYDVRPLPGTDGAYAPFFSPDGQSIGFFSGSQLKVVSLGGGGATPLTDVRNAKSGAWMSDDVIAIADGEGLFFRVISVSTGDDLIDPESSQQSARDVASLHDEKGVVAITPGAGGLYLTAISEGNERTEMTLLDGAGLDPATPRIVLPGHIVFSSGSNISAVAFDPGSLEIEGRPVRVLPNVRVEAVAGSAQYAVSREGTLVYAPGGNVSVGKLSLVDRTGLRREASFDEAVFGAMNVAPDGRYLAVSVRGVNWDIWVYDLQGREQPRRITRGDGASLIPVWSPDGREIYYQSSAAGVRQTYRTPAFSSGAHTAVEEIPSGFILSDISVDGVYLLVYGIYANEIRLINASDPTDSRPLAQSDRFSIWNGTLSPDGKYLAFQSEESGRFEIYVRALEGNSDPVQVSFSGGMDPIWARDGNSIYYHHVEEIYQVTIETAPVLASSQTELLFTGDYIDLAGKGWAYDPASDRFVLARSVEEAHSTTRLRVITNWGAELNRLAPR